LAIVHWSQVAGSTLLVEDIRVVKRWLGNFEYLFLDDPLHGIFLPPAVVGEIAAVNVTVS
jgi:hypothetical protein